MNSEYLRYIYDITNPPADDKDVDTRVYNVINAALVLHGIRPGALLTSISTDKHADFITRTSNIGYEGKQYPIDPSAKVVIVYNPQKEIYRSYYDAIQPYSRNAEDYSTQSEWNQRLDENVGRLLGYYNPAPLSVARTYRYSVKVCTYLHVNGAFKIMHMLPQRIETITDDILRDLAKKEKEIKGLQLPDEFRILDACANIQLFPTQQGGRKYKKTRRQRKYLN
jgi:hypothetical protein